MKQIGTFAVVITLLVALSSQCDAETEISSAVQQLTAPEDYNRSRAARALGQMGDEAISAYNVLYKVALSDDVPKVRHAAASALGKIAHERAVDQFIQELQTNSVATIREHSVDAFIQHPMRNATATVPLFQALRDKDEKVRKRAAITLQFYKNEELERLLLESLSDPTDKARERAPWLLGRMDSQAALDPLHGLLDDNSVDFRKSVVAALRDIQSEDSVSPLIEVVKHDNNDDVRMRAIQCLGELGDPRASTTVAAALDDENPEIRAYAAGAVAALGVEHARPRLREISKQGIGRERLAAIGALCQMQDTNVIPVIRQHLDSEHDIIVGYMIEGLVELGAEAELLRLQQHSNPLVRSAAESAVKELRKGTEHPTRQIQRTR
ncbi:MAG: HEAT repeat domain-containing protein [Pirellulaceae bacterium]